MLNYRLELIVFMSGAMVMILEIVGSRLLAPFIGTSIIAWSTLIGVILGSLSLGYYLGGRWADKDPSWHTFSKILFLATLGIAVISTLQSFVLTAWLTTFSDLRLRAVMSAVSLFFVPSLFLGMVSPYAVRLKLQSVNSSGATVGRLYALSTVGSIVGTFVSGFVLIPFFGTNTLLTSLAVALGFISFLAYTGRKRNSKLGLMCLLIILFLANGFFRGQLFAAIPVDVDTAYNRVLIYDGPHPDNQRLTRYLVMNNVYVQPSSAMYVESDELVFDYNKFFHLARHFQPRIRQALMIGGAGYTFPRNFLTTYPEATIDVVEIDPGITEIARKYFRLQDNRRLNIFHEDGRMYLNRTDKKYDVIFGDSFTSFYSLPFQLTTKEAVQKKYDALNSGGVVVVNVISTLEGEGARFVQAEYRTYGSVFPYVYLFPVQSTTDTTITQNIILVAVKSESAPDVSKNPDPELEKYLGHLYAPHIPTDTPILTDDFAPVDNFIIKLIPDAHQ